MISIAQSQERDCVFLALLYLLSQLTYKYVLVAPFVSHPLYSFWQYLDPLLLQQDMGASLLYLHAQPPLMNMTVGLLMKLSPHHYALFLEWTYFAGGFLALFILNKTLILLEVRQSIRWLVWGMLCFFPSFYLYANWAYSTHLEFCLCCWLFYALVRMQQSSKWGFSTALSLFIPFCLLGLLRAQWHMLLVIALFFILLSFRRWTKGYVMGAAAAILPLIAIYSKNAVLFGFFGASSWMGMNLAQVAEGLVSPQEIEQLQHQGKLSSSFPLAFKHEKILAYARDHHEKDYNEQILKHAVFSDYKLPGEPNRNALAYIDASRQDQKDALVILTHFPGRYIAHVLWRMLVISTVPSAAHECCDFSLRNIHAIPMTYDEFSEGLKWIIRLVCLQLYIIAPVLTGMLVWKKDAYIQGNRLVIVTGLFLMFSMLLLSCAANTGEQERMRWSLEPFYIAFLAMLVEALKRTKRVS